MDHGPVPEGTPHVDGVGPRQRVPGQEVVVDEDLLPAGPVSEVHRAAGVAAPAEGGVVERGLGRKEV